jgi:hypothetical protein
MQLVLPALPNDPGVTGVSGDFVPPVTIGVVDSPWLLFRDSFESAQLSPAHIGIV